MAVENQNDFTDKNLLTIPTATLKHTDGLDSFPGSRIHCMQYEKQEERAWHGVVTSHTKPYHIGSPLPLSIPQAMKHGDVRNWE